MAIGLKAVVFEIRLKVRPIIGPLSDMYVQPRFRPRTFFKLSSAEHEICLANKSQITKKCIFFLAKLS